MSWFVGFAITLPVTLMVLPAPMVTAALAAEAAARAIVLANASMTVRIKILPVLTGHEPDGKLLVNDLVPTAV